MIDSAEVIRNSNKIYGSVIQIALNNRHNSIVKYLFESGIYLNFIEEFNSSIYLAALDGNLELIKYLVQSGIKYDHNVMRYAIFGAHFDIVKYLFEINAPMWTNTIPESFARKYHQFGNPYVPQEEFRKIMKYLLIRGVKYITKYNGHNYSEKINELISEMILDISPIVSEYIGQDVSSIIIEYYKPCEDIEYHNRQEFIRMYGEKYW